MVLRSKEGLAYKEVAAAGATVTKEEKSQARRERRERERAFASLWICWENVGCQTKEEEEDT